MVVWCTLGALIKIILFLEMLIFKKKLKLSQTKICEEN
jgi:hypothetical protein